MDEKGRIVDVGNSPDSLFGFDTLKMLGRHVSDFVDVFRQPGNGRKSAQQALV